MACARTGLLPSERSLLVYFLGLHVAQVTDFARFQGGLPEGIAAVELAGLVREAHQPRMARLQPPDLGRIGVKRPGSPGPAPFAGAEAVSLGADDGQPVRADKPARAAQAAGQLEVHGDRSRAGRD